MGIDGTKSSVIVALPCALAGIVIGEVVLLGSGFASAPLLPPLRREPDPGPSSSTVMIIIMGMGMPTSAAYIMSAVLLAPAMQNLGVEAIVAHMFIFGHSPISGDYLPKTSSDRRSESQKRGFGRPVWKQLGLPWCLL